MGKETESQWRANLDEARQILSEIRETLISSWLMIHSTDNKDERIILGRDWGEAVREEIELAEDVIAPAKKQLGLPLTDRNQERRVIRRAGKISERYGGTIEEEKEIPTRQKELPKKSSAVWELINNHIPRHIDPDGLSACLCT